MVTGEREEGRSHGFPLFLFGVLLGIAGTIVLPRVLGPRLPGALRTGKLMEGRVLAKMQDGNRLLLKVQTDGDVYLATFEQRQREIDLLVDRGDLLTLEVRGTDPFPLEPEIRRVRKPQSASMPPEPIEADSSTTGGTREPSQTTVPAEGQEAGEAAPETPVPALADSSVPEP